MPETTGFANANYLGTFGVILAGTVPRFQHLFLASSLICFNGKFFHTTRYRKNLLYLITMSICVPHLLSVSLVRILRFCFLQKAVDYWYFSSLVMIIGKGVQWSR
jgi:hypothetical protein